MNEAGSAYSNGRRPVLWRFSRDDSRARERPLSAEEVTALLRRKRDATVMVPAHERREALRIRFAFANHVPWVPAWSDPSAFYVTPRLRVECELNEFDELKEWRSVLLLARVDPVSPTADAVERVLWREGAMRLQPVAPGFASTDLAAMSNRVLLRLEIEDASGLAVHLR